jgi:hypothetical protein
MTINSAADAGQKAIDSMNLKSGAARVVPSLQIWIPPKNDWQVHFSQMTQHQTTILNCMNQLAPILSMTPQGGFLCPFENGQNRKVTADIRDKR